MTTNTPASTSTHCRRHRSRCGSRGSPTRRPPASPRSTRWSSPPSTPTASRRAHRAVQGADDDGLRLLHQLRLRQGSRAAGASDGERCCFRGIRSRGRSSSAARHPRQRAESEAYFATRPRGSQIGAWASAQSRTVPSRETLEQQYDEADRRFADREVPCPPHWGGYPRRPLDRRVLAGPPGPAARPAALPARRHQLCGLGGRTTDPVTSPPDEPSSAAEGLRRWAGRQHG